MGEKGNIGIGLRRFFKSVINYFNNGAPDDSVDKACAIIEAAQDDFVINKLEKQYGESSNNGGQGSKSRIITDKEDMGKQNGDQDNVVKKRPSYTKTGPRRPYVPRLKPIGPEKSNPNGPQKDYKGKSKGGIEIG